MSRDNEIEQIKSTREMLEQYYRMVGMNKRLRDLLPAKDYRCFKITIEDVDSGEQYQDIYTYFKPEEIEQLWEAVYKASNPDEFYKAIDVIISGVKSESVSLYALLTGRLESPGAPRGERAGISKKKAEEYLLKFDGFARRYALGGGRLISKKESALTKKFKKFEFLEYKTPREIDELPGNRNYAKPRGHINSIASLAKQLGIHRSKLYRIIDYSYHYYLRAAEIYEQWERMQSQGLTDKQIANALDITQDELIESIHTAKQTGRTPERFIALERLSSLKRFAKDKEK